MDIGEPIREIDVQPHEEPVPDDVPVRDEPLEVPEEVPA